MAVKSIFFFEIPARAAIQAEIIGKSTGYANRHPATNSRRKKDQGKPLCRVAKRFPPVIAKGFLSL